MVIISSYSRSASSCSNVWSKVIFPKNEVVPVPITDLSKLFIICRMASGETDSNISILNSYVSNAKIFRVRLSLILVMLLSWIYYYLFIRDIGGVSIIGKSSDDIHEEVPMM